MRSDSELVAAARAGDRSAFAALIDRHGAAVEALVRRLLRDRHEAEDVAQEAFLQAYLGLARLRDPARFGSWLRAIAANLARMRLRQLRGGRSRADVTGGERVELLDDAVHAAELAELVRHALDRLTPAQRQVVFMHELEGRTTAEIAALLEESPGTVRVRLHRARAQLRARLSNGRRERTMIEVTLDDVVVRVLTDDAGDGTRLADERLRVVVLKERDGRRVLPIWIGAAEGDALALELGGESMPRPLTADLMARLVAAAGARVERVVISSLREKTFYATVALAVDGRREELDARPSDALNLAARVAAPIFVEPEVMEEAGIDVAERDDRMHALEREWLARGEEPAAPSEWRPLTPELVKALHPGPAAK